MAKGSWKKRFDDDEDEPESTPVRGMGFELKKFPRVLIHVEALHRLQAYIDEYGQEISGMGFVDVTPAGDLMISEVFLVEQDSTSAAHVDISNGVFKYVKELVKADREQDVERMRLWWHSHVNMNTFWSGTDDGTATSLGGDWLLSIVGNKRGERRVRLDIRKPFPMLFDDLALKVVYGADDKLRASVIAEIKEKTRRASTGSRIMNVITGTKPSEHKYTPVEVTPAERQAADQKLSGVAQNLAAVLGKRKKKPDAAADAQGVAADAVNPPAEATSPGAEAAAPDSATPPAAEPPPAPEPAPTSGEAAPATTEGGSEEPHGNTTQ